MDLEKSADVNREIDNSLFSKICTTLYVVVCGLAIIILGIHFVYVTADMAKRLMGFYTRFPLIIVSPISNWYVPYVITPALLFCYLLCLAKLSIYLMSIFLRQLNELIILLKLKS